MWTNCSLVWCPVYRDRVRFAHVAHLCCQFFLLYGAQCCTAAVVCTPYAWGFLLPGLVLQTQVRPAGGCFLDAPALLLRLALPQISSGSNWCNNASVRSYVPARRVASSLARSRIRFVYSSAGCSYRRRRHQRTTFSRSVPQLWLTLSAATPQLWDQWRGTRR